MEPQKKRYFTNFLKIIKIRKDDSLNDRANHSSDMSYDKEVVPLVSPEQSLILEQENAKKKARSRIDDLLYQAIQAKDTEKIEMILKRDFDMNRNHFSKLCYNLINGGFTTDSTALYGYLHEKYHRDIKYDIDATLLLYATEGLMSTDDGISYQGFINELQRTWSVIDKKEEFSDKEYALEFREVVDKLEKKLQKQNDKYSDNYSKRELMKLLSPLATYIDEKYREHYQIEKLSARQAELLEFSQELNEASHAFNNNDTIKHHIKLALRENINRLSTLKIPDDAQKLVDHISKTASELRPLELEAQQKLEFDNLYIKRLPQIIQEYINISPRYREAFKDHPQNPDTILLGSLSEIKTQIEAIFISVQEDNFKKQKVSYQYLKNK